MHYIVPALFYSALAGWGGYFVYKYKKTSETKYLKGLGNYVLFLTFWLSLLSGSKAVIFPGTTWVVYVILLGGALAGLALKSFYYEGERKLWALLHVALFVAFVSFLVSSLNYFRVPILVTNSVEAVTDLVPEAAGHIENLPPERKAEVGARLAAQLSSPDRFARIGALVRLQSIPEAIPAAVPAMAAAIPSCDEDSLEIMFGMLERLGPAAADAKPAIEARLASLPADSRAAYRGQDALKAISVIPGTGSGN